MPTGGIESIAPDKYVEWFLPISAEILKPSGALVLNIKEGVVAGECHTYVIELILALERRGWLRNLSSTRSIFILAGGKSFPRRVGVPAPV